LPSRVKRDEEVHELESWFDVITPTASLQPLLQPCCRCLSAAYRDESMSSPRSIGQSMRMRCLLDLSYGREKVQEMRGLIGSKRMRMTRWEEDVAAGQGLHAPTHRG
jgi:hypothetical protein